MMREKKKWFLTLVHHTWQYKESVLEDGGQTVYFLIGDRTLHIGRQKEWINKSMIWDIGERIIEWG